MKGIALRKHSMYEKTAASVLLKLFISSNEWCNTTDKHDMNPISTPVYPFLPVRVLHVLHAPGVPLFPQTHQLGRPEPVLPHDDEVDKEASRGLDHPDLTVRHAD